MQILYKFFFSILVFISPFPTLDDHKYSFILNPFTALDDDRMARGRTTG